MRSDDIKTISDDGNGGARLTWLTGTELCFQRILGTARESADRIAQDELDMIGRVEAHRYQVQQQLQAGYPVPPVKRGRQ